MSKFDGKNNSTHGSCGKNLEWDYRDGKLVISGKGEMEDYGSSDSVPWYNYRKVIKEIVVADGVTTIGTRAFFDTSVENVVLPNGLFSIEYWAFSKCKKLKGITLPDSVKYINSWAFSECEKLKNIILPGNVERINGWAFSGCESLMEAIILHGAKSIGDHAFCECRNLVRVIIPQSLSGIDDYAFYGCKNLKVVAIPNSVTYIGEDAFYECDNLTIRSSAGSYASEYAKECGISFEEC